MLWCGWWRQGLWWIARILDYDAEMASTQRTHAVMLAGRAAQVMLAVHTCLPQRRKTHGGWLSGMA